MQREIKDLLADAVLQSSSTSRVFEAGKNFSLHQRFKIKQLRNITNASESLCEAILEKENFDLDASIEHYYRGDYNDKKDKVTEITSQIGRSMSPDEMAKLTQLKNITQASDAVCESILRKQKFDLNASIEAFYRGEQIVK